jgi:hypothetical protein
MPILRRGTSTTSPLTFEGFIDHLLKIVEGKPELEELIIATTLIDGSHNFNQELAAQLNTTPADIVNRKKRLLNIEKVKRLYGQRRKRE